MRSRYAAYATGHLDYLKSTLSRAEQADFDLSDYGILVNETAQLQRDLSRTLGIGEPRERIYVFLFSNGSTSS